MGPTDHSDMTKEEFVKTKLMKKPIASSKGRVEPIKNFLSELLYTP